MKIDCLKAPPILPSGIFLFSLVFKIGWCEYTLEKYAGSKTRYTCPSCGKKKVLALYVDTESNNEYLNDQVGRCNREVECGYHYTPKLYFADNDIPLPEREAASYTVALSIKYASSMIMILRVQDFRRHCR